MKLLNEAAERHLNRDFDGALVKLDEADKIKPDLADSLNLRGAVYLEKREFEKAEPLFQKALTVEQNAFWPRYNLAEMELLRKNYKAARERFEKISATGAFAEVISFKIVLTYLLEGNFDAADARIETLKFPGDSAAYYYTHAAEEQARGRPAEAAKWIDSARSIFGPDRCRFFHEALIDVGWLERVPAKQ